MMFLGNRLYSVKRHKVLAKILDSSVQDLKEIAKNSKSYYDIYTVRKNGKPRVVENPKSNLKSIA